MGKKITLLILTLALVGILAAAGILYKDLGKDLAPDRLAVQTQPTSEPVTESTAPLDTTAPAGTTEPQITLAPDFTVYDREGNPHKLSDFFGKPIVLNFWASWCGPCKSEMPEFQQVFAEMGEQVQFLMVNATVSDTMADAKSFINQYGYTFPVLFDTRGEALYTYGVDAFPTTFFLDKTGTVAGYVVGAISKDTLLKGIGMITK